MHYKVFSRRIQLIIIPLFPTIFLNVKQNDRFITINGENVLISDFQMLASMVKGKEGCERFKNHKKSTLCLLVKMMEKMDNP